MQRYSLIHEKMPREFVLLQSKGCKWGKCTFCDYHLDRNSSPFETNRLVLSKVTGVYGVLDVINSGSAIELDSQTIDLINKVVEENNYKDNPSQTVKVDAVSYTHLTLPTKA